MRKDNAMQHLLRTQARRPSRRMERCQKLISNQRNKELSRRRGSKYRHHMIWLFPIPTLWNLRYYWSRDREQLDKNPIKRKNGIFYLEDDVLPEPDLLPELEPELPLLPFEPVELELPFPPDWVLGLGVLGLELEPELTLPLELPLEPELLEPELEPLPPLLPPPPPPLRFSRSVTSDKISGAAAASRSSKEFRSDCGSASDEARGEMRRRRLVATDAFMAGVLRYGLYVT